MKAPISVRPEVSKGIPSLFYAIEICSRGCLIGCLLSAPAFAQSEKDPLQDEIRSIVIHSARSTLFGPKSEVASPQPNQAFLKKPGGIFVTITKNGNTRGCWGSVEPQTGNLASEIALDTRKALLNDYRFQPVNPAEWKDLRYHVSLVGVLEPVEDWRSLRPLREGLLVLSGGRGGVLLPGEAKTAVWQVNECRRKAGVMPGKPVRMFKFGTRVFGPLAP